MTIQDSAIKGIVAMPTTKTISRPQLASQRRKVARKIAIIQGEVEDLSDSLELLEARAKDSGVHYSANEVRAKLNLGCSPGTRRLPGASGRRG